MEELHELLAKSMLWRDDKRRLEQLALEYRVEIKFVRRDLDDWDRGWYSSSVNVNSGWIMV